MGDMSRLFSAAGVSEASLVRAAAHGDRTEVKRLLSAGEMSASAKNDALCVAALRGHSHVVETMLQAGADPHALADEPLRFATQKQHAAVISVLRTWIDQEEGARRSPKGRPPSP